MADNAVTKIEPTAPITPAQESAAIIQVIERAAQNPNVDVEKMERLLKMSIDIQIRNAERAFNVAMVAAQRETKAVTADADNKQTRSRYATYQQLDKALRPIYTKNGFAVSFDTRAAEGEYITILARVSHEEGYTRTYEVTMPADGKGAKGGDVMTKTHATGAAMSYGMRYLLKMIFNVAVGEDDEDGNATDWIDEGQAADLEALAEEVGANKANFLKYMGAESFARIPAVKYQDALAALNRKKKVD